MWVSCQRLKKLRNVATLNIER